MEMHFARTLSRTAAVLTVAVVGACSDSTGPVVDNIDAAAATAAVQPVMNVMEQQALASFGSLTDVPGLPASTSAAALGAVARLTNAAAHGRWDGSAPALARAAARSADVLPGDVLGKLYTWNTTTLRYEGAANGEVPPTAAWIVLYAWDVLNNRPATPLNPIGMVKLNDLSTDTEDKLNVVVEKSDATVLMDYTITRAVTPSSESFSIEGSASNGTTTLNFDLSGTSDATTATVTFDLSAPSVGFTLHIGAYVNAETQQATVDMALGYDGHSLVFEMAAAPNRVSCEIKYDQARYASLTVTYNPETDTETVVFVKANRRPWTSEELEQLEALFDRALNLDRFWEGLLWPIAVLPAVA
jgi:hypothetical protein